MKCDGCGCHFKQIDGEPVVSNNRSDLIEMAEDSQWKQIKNRWYCPDCYAVDDEDNYTPITALMCFATSSNQSSTNYD